MEEPKTQIVSSVEDVEAIDGTIENKPTPEDVEAAKVEFENAVNDFNRTISFYTKRNN